MIIQYTATGYAVRTRKAIIAQGLQRAEAFELMALLAITLQLNTGV